MTWTVHWRREAPATFHARSLPDPLTRQVWVCEPTGPALVLGSAQRGAADAAACAAAGVDVVRRRSGGGAVLVVPGNPLWVDVLLPVDDPLWQHDVGRSFLWLGEAWALALDDVGVETSVHRGPLVRTPWSDLVCFAGLGTGELTDPSGRKVLGMSQRRTRLGARFQCAVLSSWDPSAIVALLDLPPPVRAAAAAELAAAAVGVGARLAGLCDALFARLP
ncbi:MAG: lipoyl protein ligase domain-containing protein [Microthrixaceae bacterium]